MAALRRLRRALRTTVGERRSSGEDPGSSAPNTPTGEELSAARAATQRRDWTSALELWERYLTIAGLDALGRKDRDRLQRCRLHRARELRSVARWDEADQLLDALFATEPDHRKGRRDHAQVAAMRGDWDEATRRWQRALAVDGGPSERVRRLVKTLEGGPPEDPPEHVAQGRTLVIVESDVEPVIVSLLLHRLEPEHVLTARSSTELPPGPWRTTQLEDLYTMGDAHDEALAGSAQREGDEVFDRLMEALPETVTSSAIGAVIEELRYDFIAGVFRELRIHDAATSRLTSFEGHTLVFLHGEGRLVRLLAPDAKERLGPNDVLGWDARAGTTDRGLRNIDSVQTRLSPDDREGAGSPLVQASSDLVSLTREIRFGRRDVPDTERDARGRPCFLAWPLANHTASLVPVVRELALSGPVTVQRLSDRPRHHELYRPFEELDQGPLSVTLHDDVAGNGAPEDEVAEVCLRLAAAAADAAMAGAPLERLEPLREQIHHELVDVVARVLPRAWAYARKLDDWFARHQPSPVIITRERGWKNRIGVLVAQLHGIPTLLIQASLLSPSARHAPVPTDHVTVLDAYARDLHIQHFGVAADSVTVTGFPGFDQLRESPASTAERASQPTVLLAMQRGSVEDAERTIRAVAGAIAHGTSDARLIVKAHPKSTSAMVSRYRSLLEDLHLPGRAELATDGDIHAMIRSADLVVSGWSTTLLEAALLDRPSLSVSLDDAALPLPLVEMGVAHAVHSEAELAEALPELLCPSDLRDEVRRRRREYLAANPHLVAPPTAARRIAGVIESLHDGRARP